MTDNPKLLKAAVRAAATLNAIYEWLDRVDGAGGATSIEGVAVCNAMLKSFRDNRARAEELVMQPLRELIDEEKAK